MRRRLALTTAVTLVAAAAVTPSAATAKTTTAPNVVSPTKNIQCYALTKAARKIEHDSVQCLVDFDAGGSKQQGGSYVGLPARGRAHVGHRSDYPGSAGKPVKLGYGDSWRRYGVNCKLRESGMTCTNKSGHGFKARKGRVKRF